MCNPFGVQVLNNWWRSMQNKFIFGAPGPLPYRSSWPSQPAEAHFKPFSTSFYPVNMFKPCFQGLIKATTVLSLDIAFG
jgi:hypothetical protein